MKHRALVLASACAAFGCAALWVSLARAPDSPETRQKKLILDGATAYKTISKWTDAADQNGFRVALTDLAVRGDPLDADRTSRLCDAVSEFVFNRFGQHDPAAYRAWRCAHTKSWVPLSELISLWQIDATYKRHLGESMPEGISTEQAFDSLWKARISQEGRPQRIVKLSAEPKGLAAVHGTMTPNRPARGYLSGELTTEQWHGSIAITMCSWRQPHRNTRALLQKFRKAEYVDVGLIVEFADGARRPLILTFLWDPVDRFWSLENLNLNNTAVAGIQGIDY